MVCAQLVYGMRKQGLTYAQTLGLWVDKQHFNIGLGHADKAQTLLRGILPQPQIDLWEIAV